MEKAKINNIYWRVLFFLILSLMVLNSSCQGQTNHKSYILEYKLLREYRTSNFIEHVNSGKHPFYQAMVKNRTCNFSPHSPTRLIHSPSDILIPYEISQSAFTEMEKLGAKNLELIPLGKALDHHQACLVAIYRARQWFDNFK